MQAPMSLTYALLDKFRELAGTLEGLLPPPRDYRLGDPLGFRLIAILLKRSSQVGFGYRCQYLRRGSAAGAIHTHVERPVARVGKPPIRIIDLHARHAEVGEDC